MEGGPQAQALGGNDLQQLATTIANILANAIANQPQPQLRALEPGPQALKLSEKPDVAEFTGWENAFRNFEVRQRAATFSNKERIASMIGHFSPEFSKIYDSNIKRTVVAADANDPTIEEAIIAIKAHVRQNTNILIDRYNFMNRKQEEGESFETFYADLRRLSTYADACQNCLATTLITLITIGVRDKKLRKNLLKISPAPDIARVERECRSWETAEADVNKTDNTPGTSSSNVNVVKNKQSNRSKSRNRWKNKSQGGQTPSQSTKEWVCYGCGSKSKHTDASPCPAKNVTCRFCNGKSHFEKVCFKKKNSKNVGTIKVQQAGINESSWDCKEDVRVTLLNGKSVTIKMHPDTGAQANILPICFLQKLGLQTKMLKPTNTVLVSFDGSRRRAVGSLSCKLSFGGKTTDARFIVSGGASDVLLCGETAEQLGLIIIPHRIKQVVVKENVLEVQKMKLLQEFQEVFDDNGTQLRPMAGGKMKIHVSPDAQPYAQYSARQVAFDLRDKVAAELDDMERRGIIEKVGDEPTQWSHPMVIVWKPNGKIRITIDYTRLNTYVSRPAYPLRTPKDAIDAIKPGDKFFTTLDAKQGYWQLELAEEARPLTTFISQQGRYRFLRAPMGLSATGDEYCRRGDAALAGVKCVEKVVDDIIIHTATLDEHVKKLREVLERCRSAGITLNKEKFIFAQDTVKYVGYLVGKDGIAADPEKIGAIQNFPSPNTLTALRSFMGMVNQLGCFSTEIAHAATPLRSLTKKGTIFNWTVDHQNAFKAVKAALLLPPLLEPYDPKCPLVLHTDAARNGGLGFALVQPAEGGKRLRLIQCGSRFITPTESRYAMIELELLAIVWAVTKCRLYLLGRDFNVITDHRPLITVVGSKNMAEIDNPRIIRLKQKLSPFTFKIEWRKGSSHKLPDALSRSPVSQPEVDDLTLEKELTSELAVKINYIAATLQDHDENYNSNTHDLLLGELKEETKKDVELQAVARYILEGFPSPAKMIPKTRPFYKLREDMSIHDDLILYGQRIVIPGSKRREILAQLHLSHQGLERTRRRAMESVFWPGISADIKNTISECIKCQYHRPSLAAEPEVSDPKPSQPFQEIATDLFEYNGRHYMVIVDRFSGWWEVYNMRGSPDAAAVQDLVDRWCCSYGHPVKVRSDGGLQYSSASTAEFMKARGIHHAFSAPHFASSNGLAESAVKSAKHLLMSTGETDVNNLQFRRAILALRNMPRADGSPSPSVAVFGRPLRNLLPQLVQKGSSTNTEEVPEATTKSGRGPHAPLKIGQKCWIQDQQSKRWSSTGTITELMNRNYVIKLESGRFVWRNRRHVRPRVLPEEVKKENTKILEDQNSEKVKKSVHFDLNQPLRRSSRSTRKPKRFDS